MNKNCNENWQMRFMYNTHFSYFLAVSRIIYQNVASVTELSYYANISYFSGLLKHLFRLHNIYKLSSMITQSNKLALRTPSCQFC